MLQELDLVREREFEKCLLIGIGFMLSLLALKKGHDFYITRLDFRKKWIDYLDLNLFSCDYEHVLRNLRGGVNSGWVSVGYFSVIVSQNLDGLSKIPCCLRFPNPGGIPAQDLTMNSFNLTRLWSHMALGSIFIENMFLGWIGGAGECLLVPSNRSNQVVSKRKYQLF